MTRNALSLLFAALALVLVGCRIAPVYDAPRTEFVTSRPVTASEVEQTIRQAGASLGWQVVQRGPGKLEGVLALRDHRAVVDISYDTRSYSIKYKDSSNLQYDGANIHRNYNGWVQNLDNTIRARLSAL